MVGMNQASTMQEEGGGTPKAYFHVQGVRGSGEGLNLLTWYLNSPLTLCLLMFQNNPPKKVSWKPCLLILYLDEYPLLFLWNVTQCWLPPSLFGIFTFSIFKHFTTPIFIGRHLKIFFLLRGDNLQLNEGIWFRNNQIIISLIFTSPGL